MNLFQFIKDLMRSKTRIDTVESRRAGLLSQPVPGARVEIDNRSAGHIARLDPHFQDNARQFLGAAKVVAAEFGCDYIIISGTRTWAEQDALYAQGRFKPGKVVTKAKAGHSNHNYDNLVHRRNFGGQHNAHGLVHHWNDCHRASDCWNRDRGGDDHHGWQRNFVDHQPHINRHCQRNHHRCRRGLHGHPFVGEAGDGDV
jgi:hypothetical protein